MYSTHELAQALLAGPDVRIVIQKDGDGNAFSPFADLRAGHYRPHNAWDGWVSDTPSTSTVPCIVLEPIN